MIQLETKKSFKSSSHFKKEYELMNKLKMKTNKFAHVFFAFPSSSRFCLFLCFNINRMTMDSINVRTTTEEKR